MDAMKCNKDGWVKKKLGEVCKIKNGKNQKKVFNPNGLYPIYGSGGIMGYADEYICEAGTTIIGRKGTINRPLYVNERFWNVDTAFGLQPGENTNCRFLYFLCKSIDFTQYDKSVTIPSLVKSDLIKIDVFVPTEKEQQRIVSELDCLNGIIEKQKEQLKQLDELAQSIFYDMFGDPVENEKEWEVCALQSVCDVRDGTHDSPKYLQESEYFLLTSKNIVNGFLDFSSVNFICKEDYDNINKRSQVCQGDILMAMIGTIGKPIIVKNIDKKFAIKNMALIKFYSESRILNIYLHGLLNTQSYSDNIMRLNKGGTQKFIALGTIRNLKIMLPPLDLQQAFASKVEAIEHQKELIKKSIAETENLFNSRMDYYFG